MPSCDKQRSERHGLTVGALAPPANMADQYHAGLGHQDALEDFGKIPEVEGVVGLGRRRKQLRGDGGVDANGGIYQRLIQRLDGRHRL